MTPQWQNTRPRDGLNLLLVVRYVTVPLAWAAVSISASLLAGGGLLPDGAPLVRWLWGCLPWITAVRLAIGYFFDVYLRTQRNIELPSLFVSLSAWLAYLAVGLVTFRLQNTSASAMPLLATSAATSVVVGFALQPALSNLFAGIVVSIDRPFRLNDLVRIGGIEGRVAAMSWHSTSIRTGDNYEVIIANTKLADEPIVNLHYPHPMLITRVRVGADLSEPPYRVTLILVEAARGLETLLDTPAPEASLVEFAPDCAVYEVRAWVGDAADAGGAANELRSRVWIAFRRNGLRLTFPGSVLREREADASPGGASPRLFCISGTLRGRSFPLTEAATIGRSPTCTVQLVSKEASSEHARLESDQQGWRVTDLGSRFGTLVNGTPVATRHLEDLDRIAVADCEFIFEACHVR
jgi:small-conductance mechanosensitive channel